MKNRPAVRKGMDVGKDERTFSQKPTKESLKMMFQQDSDSIAKAAERKKGIMKLELGNYEMEMIFHDPLIFTLKGVLTEKECQHFIEIASNNLK